MRLPRVRTIVKLHRNRHGGQQHPRRPLPLPFRTGCVLRLSALPFQNEVACPQSMYLVLRLHQLLFDHEVDLLQAWLQLGKREHRLIDYRKSNGCRNRLIRMLPGSETG